MKGKKKATVEQRVSPDSQVWINPNSTFKGPQFSRTWGRHDQALSTARLLELGDIALGLKKSAAPLKSKKAAA